jgi:hypothetical protein
MPSLTDALQAFNRRERHLLVGWVLDRLTFPLGYEFRKALSRALGGELVPADSYVAMDYNLNWLAGALMWAAGDTNEGKAVPYEASHGVELSDNSDTDLLIAFARGTSTEVVLLEAKGFTPWDRKQLRHKIKRLNSIFGEDGKRFETVAPRWVFVSPGPPPTDLEWATWMKEPGGEAPRYIPLPQPASHKFLVGRCDSSGKPKDGDHWMIRPDPGPPSWRS